MTDRIDFKPIYEDSADKIFQYLKNKAAYYKGKKIANVTIIIDKKKEKTNGIVFRYKITIYKINENGEVAKKRGDTWGLKINYTLDDFDDLYSNNNSSVFTDPLNSFRFLNNLDAGVQVGKNAKRMRFKIKGLDNIKT